MPGGPEYPVLGGVEHQIGAVPPGYSKQGVVVPTVTVGFIASATAVHAPTASAAGFVVPFISSVTAVHAPTLASRGFIAPFIASVTVVHPPPFPLHPFLSTDARFGAPAFGWPYFAGAVAEGATALTLGFGSVTAVYTPELRPHQTVVPFIGSATVVHAPALGATATQVIVTTPGTYTWFCPANITHVYVEAIGAGGGGNTAAGNAGHGAGGGGAYAARTSVPVTPGTLYTFVVGAGGVAGSDGADSTFTGDSGTQVIAKGGQHPSDNDRAAGAGGLASASTGDTGLKFDGGNGGQGVLGPGNDGAGGGASGNRLAAGAVGTDAPGRTGGVGANGGGSGGLGGTYVGPPFAVGGGVPGGGGGGAGGSDGVGGTGGSGEIVITAGIIPPFIPSHTVVYPPTTSPAQRFAPFIASVTSVHAPTLHSLGFRAPFISSHTVVYTPSLQGTFIDVPFISSNTILHPPTLRVTFTGGGVSQVVLEVITSGGVPDAQVTQVTLEIIVPMYKGLHVWQRS